jgi:hypothetical protein
MRSLFSSHQMQRQSNRHSNQRKSHETAVLERIPASIVCQFDPGFPYGLPARASPITCPSIARLFLPLSPMTKHPMVVPSGASRRFFSLLRSREGVGLRSRGISLRFFPSPCRSRLQLRHDRTPSTRALAPEACTHRAEFLKRVHPQPTPSAIDNPDRPRL